MIDQEPTVLNRLLSCSSSSLLCGNGGLVLIIFIKKNKLILYAGDSTLKSKLA